MSRDGHITNICGLRYTIVDNFQARPDDRARFMFEMNRAGALFADNAKILNGIRDFYDAVANKRGDGMKRIIDLIRMMGRETALNVDALSDTDVTKVFLLPGAEQIIVQFVPVPVAPPTGPITTTAVNPTTSAATSNT